jgi:hypothetical protein
LAELVQIKIDGYAKGNLKSMILAINIGNRYDAAIGRGCPDG